ncbi:MAG: prohibitin family protein [Patescibacteria group bacterium]|jgi:regulator of protease activity HflC (stomatin/prohibitin superfamily)
MKTKYIVALVTGAVLLILVAILNPFVTVGAGERGVVLTWGAVNGQIMSPGLHLRVPLAQSVVKVDVQTQKLEIEESSAYSHDLQNVIIHSVVNYNADPKEVGLIYQQYGLDAESRILEPNLEAAIKQTVAKYTAEEILSERGKVASEIETAFRESIPSTFIVTKYALVNETFSEAYEAAIEQKQVAQQNAEKADNDLKRIKIEAEQRVAEATAEAEAIKIQAAAIQQQGGASYVNLKAVEKWDGHLPNQMIPGGALPFLNLQTNGTTR